MPVYLHASISVDHADALISSAQTKVGGKLTERTFGMLLHTHRYIGLISGGSGKELTEQNLA